MKKSNKMIIASLMTMLMVAGCGGSKTSSTAKTESSKTETSSTVASSSQQVESSIIESSTSLPVITSLVWTGVEDRTVPQRKTIGVKTGVSLKFVCDGSEVTLPLTFVKVTAEGAEIVGGNIDTASLAVGTKITLKYTVSEDFEGYAFADGVEKSKTCVITITEAETNLVTNGDFEDGTTGWALYGANFASLDVKEEAGNHYAEIDVHTQSNSSYEPRLNIEADKTGFGMYFEQGKAYQLSFKAKSTVARPILVQVGRILSADPLFYQYGTNTYNLSTEWSTYTMTFEFGGNGDGSGDDANVHLTFEMGTVNSTWEAAKIAYDDIVVQEFTGELPDEVAPVIKGADYLRVNYGETVDLLKGITATDNRDGDITDRLTYTIADSTGATVESIDNTKDGKYKVTYSVSDNAGNVATATRTVRVCSPDAEDENFFAAPTSVKNETEGYAVSNPGTLVEWHDQAWCGSTVTLNECRWDDSSKSIKLDYTSTGSCWFGMQLFYCSPNMTPGASYSYTFTLVSSVATSVTINGGVFDLVAGENKIVVASITDTSKASFSMQFGVSPSTMCPEGVFELKDFVVYSA